jgi:hypothetical protein
LPHINFIGNHVVCATDVNVAAGCGVDGGFNDGFTVGAISGPRTVDAAINDGAGGAAGAAFNGFVVAPVFP